MSTIKKVLEENKVSLRQMAKAVDAPYHKVLKASREPIPGEVYDPEATNWSALEAAFTKEQKEKLKDVDWSKFQTKQKNNVVKDTSVFTVDSKWHLRRHGWATIVYRNDSYIVFILEGEDEQPRSWAIDTWLLNGPSKEERK